MKKIAKKTYLLLPLSLFFLINCGGAKNPAAPSGSVITINPSSFALTTASTLPITYRTAYFTITVYQDSANTKPMSDIKITIDHVFASPAERYYIQFYNDGERVDSPLSVTTDNYGTYVLRVDFMSGGGVAFTGDINVRSGSAFINATFAVN
jgi:hypothetical protein